MVLLLFSVLTSLAQNVKGKVIDAKTKEPLIGAVIELRGSEEKVLTDIDGLFEIKNKNNSASGLIIRYVGYKTQEIDGVRPQGASDNGERLTIAMKPDEQQLNGVTVTGIQKRNTETAAIQQAKNSPVIVSNVSAQEISKTQDSNAGEVIRRVPGVSLIEDKFVMVRGLSQRYNNVWINGGAVPSSEADSRAFSFDIIPSTQIDNLTIVKTPASE